MENGGRGWQGKWWLEIMRRLLGKKGRPENQDEEFEVHPVNLRKLPKAFHFQQGGYRINMFYED